MAKFMLLYTGGDGMPEGEEETARVMAAWGTWYEKLGSAVVDPGNPFSPQSKIIRKDGAVNDGPGALMATGYTIVEADSLKQATQMAQGCPVLAGGSDILVLETFPVM